MGGIIQWFSCELHAWPACSHEAPALSAVLLKLSTGVFLLLAVHLCSTVSSPHSSAASSDWQLLYLCVSLALTIPLTHHCLVKCMTRNVHQNQVAAITSLQKPCNSVIFLWSTCRKSHRNSSQTAVNFSLIYYFCTAYKHEMISCNWRKISDEQVVNILWFLKQPVRLR